MKLNSALIAVAAVAAFATNVAHAAPLPPAQVQDSKSAVIDSTGNDELHARSFWGSSRDLSRLEDLNSVANQRLSETTLAESSGDGVTTARHPDIHQALTAGRGTEISPMARVVRAYQASPQSLRTFNPSDDAAWQSLNNLWHEKNAKYQLRVPPGPKEYEIPEAYARRLALSLGY